MKSLRSSRLYRAMLYSFWRNARKRLTPAAIILIILVIAVVYFFGQLFSLRLLNNDHRSRFSQVKRHPKDLRRDDVRRNDVVEKDAVDSEKRVTEESKQKYSIKKQKINKQTNRPKSSPVRREQAELKEKENKMKEEIQRVKHIRPKDMPRGVDPKLVRHYMKNSKGKFMCLKSNELIPFNRVNDDYCDCSDGSDEPGTSACSNSRFFCDYQLKDQEFSVPSSRVNDGICDCCDGSDEYDDVTVPDVFRVHGHKRKYLVSHAPCENRCKVLEKEKIEQIEMQLKGIKLKKEYLEEAKKYPVQNSKKFGPNGIFYKLSLKCYEWKTSEYEYAVCPFKHVKQQKFPKPEVDLGHYSEWVSSRPGNYQLKMTGGDSQLCPGTKRQTLLRFLCGHEDKVLNLREDEKCHYVLDFSTPAAC